MKMFSRVFAAIIVALTFTIVSCTKEIEKIIEVPVFVDQSFDKDKGVIKINFSHQFNGQPFEIKKNLTDAAGNTYRFDEIRYWFTNVEFVRANGEVVKIPDSYYLVEDRDTLFFYGTTATTVSRNASPPRKRTEVLVGNVPTGDYTKIRFAIGVDPKYNTNFTLRAGELDINQMAQVASWAWQTSYIFLRTKGVFLAKGADPLSGAQRFVAETGGNDSYRTIEMNLTAPISSKAGQVSTTAISFEVANLFEGLNVSTFSGTRPSGWAADPNLTRYERFINAGSPEQMKQLADNTEKACVKMMPKS